MGIYLSTPCTDINSEDGAGNGVKFAVAEMQGWRKNMEDAHIAIADLKSFVNSESIDNSISVFGVFDGHGGKEVAKFVKMKYPEILINLDSFRAGDIETALRESFHKTDELIEDEQHHELLKELRALPNPSDKPKEPKRVPISSGDSLFSVLRERLEGDDNEEGDLDAKNSNRLNGNISTSEAIELIRSLLSDKSTKSEDKTSSSEDVDEPQIRSPIGFESESDDFMLDSDAKDYDAISTKDAFKSCGSRENKADIEMDTSADEKSTSSANGGMDLKRDASKKGIDDDEEKTTSIEVSNTSCTTVTVVSGSNKETETKTLVRKASAKLTLDVEDNVIETTTVTTTSTSSMGTLHPTRYNNQDAVYDPPALISGNSMICKLKDHKIPAGCTAIVAFKRGNQLYVANAGDSRGVLCRQGGVAYALSEDHKPQSEIELKRITSAGGFVNAVGRINGNLNLSRSLGDMKYKQLFNLSRAEQIITAEPDISVTTIEETDRFFILACDGVWDCLTNQEAVDFVRERLDAGMDVTKIVHEVCNRCVAADPRQSTGIGSDNMTCMVVLLNQE